MCHYFECVCELIICRAGVAAEATAVAAAQGRSCRCSAGVPALQLSRRGGSGACGGEELSRRGGRRGGEPASRRGRHDPSVGCSQATRPDSESGEPPNS